MPPVRLPVGERVALFLLLVAAVGCGSESPPAPLAHHPEPQRPRDVPVADARCTGVSSLRRATLVRGVETEIAALGNRATYRGQSIDHFDDGTSAVVLSLELFGEPWLPDARDRELHAFGDHCVRIVSSTADRLELEVALQPAKKYAPDRCHRSCCVTEAQRRPGPNGEQECCFCADAPAP